MVQALIGTKICQTQQFTEDGKRIPVTVISVGPCFVSDMTTMGGQNRATISFGTLKNIAKPLMGKMKKAGLEEKKPRFLREVGIIGEDEMKIGQELHVDEVFAKGDHVRVTGISKGKGFAGVMKRHGFHGGPKTHGQSDRARSPGSIGSGTTPGRVYRGKRMAGRMGGDRVTVRGLSVVAVDNKAMTLTIKGLVPGGKDGLLVIQKEN